jgi:hypothetical protein
MPITSAQKIAIAEAVIVLGATAVYFEVQRGRALQEVDQLKAANAQLSMAELPVSVSFHRALLGGKSYVAEFGSHGASDMAVAVEWVDGSTHNRRSFRVDVGPGRPTPLGHLQGYDFEPGDMLTMSHDGFKPVMAQVQ